MKKTLFTRVLEHLIDELQWSNPSNQEERETLANYLRTNQNIFYWVFRKDENFSELVAPYIDRLPLVLEELTDMPWSLSEEYNFLELRVTDYKCFAKYLTSALINRFSDIVQYEYFVNSVSDLIRYILASESMHILDIE